MGLSKLSYPAGETTVAPSSAKSGNKKEGRSIVTSPTGWYDNAPTLFFSGCAADRVAGLSPCGRVRPPPLAFSCRGCAALKAAGALPPHPHKLFGKSLCINI